VPIYEYQCKKCKHRFEKLHQKFSDARVKKCPECGGPVEQLLSAPAVQFKGSGFYVTDYVRKGASGDSNSSDSGSSDKESTASKATEKSDSTKTESKSESKSETKSETKPPAKSEPKAESKSKKEK
jgi:putative FmdB family regulatory protein